MNSTLLDSELQYFLKIATANTLMAAADTLGLSQPALSRAMDRLEGKLGFKVFERSRKGIVLTAQGEDLLRKLKVLGEDLSSLVENIRNHSQDLSGEIKISGHQSILEDYLVPVYSTLLSTFPKVKFHLESKPSRQIVNDLLNGNCDIGLVVNPIEYSTLVMRPLFETQALFYSELKEVNRYFLSPHMIDLARFLKVIKKKFLDENNICFVDDYGVIGKLVKAKAGCGLLPMHVGQRFGLSVHREISEIFKINYKVKLVMSSSSVTEKKRQIIRKLEALVRDSISYK